MLSLTTGIPGHGKTLYTLYRIDLEFANSGRPIYYSGIDDLKLDWQVLENPERWYDCPDGSVIVIDEAQKVFPQRSANVQVPEHVKRFDTHRHKGLDVFLITQHPFLVDAWVRRFVGEHVHVSRPWGMNRFVLFRWESAQDNPLDSLRTAQKQVLSFPRKYFALYKSATLHTVKRKFPFRFFLLFFIPIFLLSVVWFFYSRFISRPSSSSRSPSSSVPGLSLLPVSSAVSSRVDPVQVAPVQVPDSDALRKRYLVMHKPVVSDAPWSAPVYDDVRKPVSYPRPICLQLAKDCRCYSQQATRLEISQDVCRSIVSRGVFDYARSDNPDSSRVVSSSQFSRSSQSSQSSQLPQPSQPSQPPDVVGLSSLTWVRK